MDPVKELSDLIRSRHSIIYIVSAEEPRIEAVIAEVAQQRGRKILYWGCSRGFVDATGEADGQGDPLTALQRIADDKTKTLYVLRDFHVYLDDPSVRRWVRDLAVALRACDAGEERTIIILAPVLKLPEELSREVAVLDWPLPDRVQINHILDELVAHLPKDKHAQLFPDPRERLIEAALGLTAVEAENVYAKSIVQRGAFRVDAVLSAKKDAIRKSGVLEFYEAQGDIGDIGGLEHLKTWLGRQRRAFSPEARAYGSDLPKGILLIGPPGTGKSLSVKIISAAWQMPLVRFDVGKMMGSLVGESESNLRRAIQIAESVAPCIVWIDEIEKAVAGSGSDLSGVTTRMVGQLLTWMTEKTAPVYIAATANDVTALPPELLRKGRFDELWVLDLPNVIEREAILSVHLQKRKRAPEKYDLALLAQKSESYSGAELEQAVIEGLRHGFDEGRELTTDDIAQAITESTPLASTFRERIEGLRAWAKGRARFASKAPEAKAVAGRKIDLETN